MNTLRRLSFATVLLIFAGALAHAAEPALTRHALVVGNSKYKESPLENPVNDAKAMAERLKQAGFSVTLKLDVSRREFSDAIRDFGAVLAKTKGVGLFYFAGHGLQLNWRNFLVPVTAHIRSKADIQTQTIDMGLLMDAMGQARNAFNIVILDACRNNPLGPDFRIDDRGLSQLDAPIGTLLAYATAPGNLAADGSGSHGLYTGNLLKEMQVPGAAVEDVFKRVRLAVRRGSQGAQIPWESTSLESDFSFLGGNARQDTSAAAKEFEADLAVWQKLRSVESPDKIEAFIRQRPSGKFSELAQYRLDELLRAKGEKAVRPVTSAPEICTPDGKSAPAAAYTLPSAPYRAGEKYVYRTINVLNQTETARTSDTVAKIVDDEVQFNDGKKVTDLFGNLVRAPDGRKWTPYQFFINDYQLGKHWPAQFLVTLPNGKQVNMSFNLRVAARERITLPSGTFDAWRIEARGANLTNGASLERTAWVAPDRVRGFLVLESVTRRDGEVVEGERVELVEYEPPKAASAQVSPPQTPEKKGGADFESKYSTSGG